MSSNASSWSRYVACHVRYPDLGFSIDISRMGFPDDFVAKQSKAIDAALKEMSALEAGAIANKDEKRMVGHYWLRNPALAPTPAIRKEIIATLDATLKFAAEVREGTIRAANGKAFTRVLVVGIGGSALGPQLISDALASPKPPLAIEFFDNTDPDGMDRIVERIGKSIATTLTLVISKSGGTKETRNGMLEAEAAYAAQGVDFAKHAVAVTGDDSELDKLAKKGKWLRRFPMWDWVGGRTSVMSAVGTIAAALQGVDVRGLLAGAAAMDAKTRSLPADQNAAMLLALMWHHAGGGRGTKDMVILPYKDRLVLLSKYLQQLVMESLGKESDRNNRVVNQGIAVYGNKGSTDQHAYVQQLRDGVNNFFATFVEVGKSRTGKVLDVEKGFNSGDYLQGFLRGTRKALAQNQRQSITLHIAQLDAYHLGLLIALFERAVSFYASLVNINAYHQPGVEAGKKAATEFLTLLGNVKGALTKTPATAEKVAAGLNADIEDVYHCLNHLAANGQASLKAGSSPAVDEFYAI